MAAGYSKRPLVEKLGIKDGFKIALVGAPESYGATLEKLPGKVKVSKRLDGPLVFVQVFCRSRQELEERLHAFRLALAPTGMLWASWPKGSSGVKTDLKTRWRYKPSG
jgi:hypothetical protein